TSLAGPLGYDAIFGSCGELDSILNQVLGPDPLPCSQRTGPIAGQPSSGAPTPASASAPTARSAAPGGGSPRTAAGQPGPTPTGFSPLGSLMSALAGSSR
ncbi:MAG: hypothetical protein ACRD0E_03245, partial [Acidimicrobiales bacterium]